MRQWLGFLAFALCLTGMMDWYGTIAQAAEQEKAYPLEQALYQSLVRGELPAAASLSSINGADYVRPEQPTVYLTFDDGPSQYTGEVLDVLAEEQVKATFFVVGDQLEKHVKVLKRIQQEGHAIGNHSYNHKYQELYGSFAAYWKQLQDTEDVLLELGVKTNLVRAPGGTSGNYDAFYFYYLQRAGYRIFDWNVDSGDAKRKHVSAKEIVKQVKNSPLKHEAIVLLHDGTGHAETVKALPDIIQYYKNRGYRFAALDDTVKPLSFAVRSTKWKRTLSMAEFQQFTHLADASLEAKHAEVKLKEQSLSVVLESKEASEIMRTPQLDLIVDDRRLRMTEADFFLKEGRIYVPVRTVLSLAGGQISWQAASGNAVAQLGERQLQITPETGKVIVQRKGESEKIYYARVEQRKYRLFMPLNELAQILNAEYQETQLEDVQQGYSASLTWVDTSLETQGQISFTSFLTRWPGWLGMKVSVKNRLHPPFSQHFIV